MSTPRVPARDSEGRSSFPDYLYPVSTREYPSACAAAADLRRPILERFLFVILSDHLPFSDGPLPLFGVSVQLPQLGRPTFGFSVRVLRLAKPVHSGVPHRGGTASAPRGYRQVELARRQRLHRRRLRVLARRAQLRGTVRTHSTPAVGRTRPPAPAPSARALLRIGRSVSALLWARHVPGVLGVLSWGT